MTAINIKKLYCLITVFYCVSFARSEINNLDEVDSYATIFRINQDDDNDGSFVFPKELDERNSNTCTTPENQPGDCVLIKSCLYIISQMEAASKPLSSNFVRYLQNHICGFEKDQPKVCCPQKSNSDKDKSPLHPTVLIKIKEIEQGVSSCNASNNLPGDCIPIRFCPHIIARFETAPKPLPSNFIEELQSYQCGSAGGQPKVCCPQETPTPKPPSLDLSELPDVSQHPKLGLIKNNRCGSTLDDRIFNGNQTKIFEFPWMVLLGYKTRQGGHRWACGGTLINEKYVLTAAHCVTNLRGKILTDVRIGEHNLETNPDCETGFDGSDCAEPYKDIAVEKAIFHPSYSNPPHRHDIALIRLSEIVDISSGSDLRPICLPTTPETQRIDLSNKPVTVAGWGKTEKGVMSSILLKVELPIVSNEKCGHIHRNVITLGFTQMCAGGVHGTDSCNGDSGGPLKFVSSFMNSARYIQHGIVSLGPKNCGTAGLPGIYTRVAYYMDWILDQLEP